MSLACAVLRRRAESLLVADGAPPPLHAAVLAWADSELEQAQGEGAEMEDEVKAARVAALLCAAAAAGVVRSADALKVLVRARRPMACAHAFTFAIVFCRLQRLGSGSELVPQSWALRADVPGRPLDAQVGSGAISGFTGPRRAARAVRLALALPPPWGVPHTDPASARFLAERRAAVGALRTQDECVECCAACPALWPHT